MIIMKLLKYPISTEKAIRLVEAENKLVFVVEKSTTKREILDEFEKVFKARVDKVNTYIDRKGKRRAYIKLNSESPAIDIATQLGLI